MRSRSRRRKFGLAIFASLLAGGIGAVAPGSSDPRCTFIGPPDEWHDVEVVVHQASPLFGASEVYIRGSGDVSLIQVSRDPDLTALEKRFELTSRNEKVRFLLRKMCEADLFSEPVSEQSGLAPTCSGPPLLLVRNAAGEVRSLPFPREQSTPERDAAWLELSSFTRLSRGVDPVHEGPYDEEFIPVHAAWWVEDILRPRKRIPWTPMLSREQAEEAERESHERDEIQRRMAEQARAEEGGR